MAQVEALQSEVQPGTARVLTAIPAYNEDRYVGSVVLKLRAAGYAVLVVDDGSSDQTVAIARAAGAEVVQHPANLGKAAAVRTAFERARQLDVDALVLLDGDSQHDPSEVGRVAAPILSGAADMVVGSRYAGVRSLVPRWRVIGQHALTLATNLGSGVRLSDSQSGFRAFSRRAVHGMTFHRTGFSVESEMQFEAKALGLRVAEVPIHVHYQLPEKRNAVRQGLNVLDVVLRLAAQHRPLLFFSVPGLLVFLAGLALGLQVVHIYDATLTLAVGYALITVLLCIVGILAIFVGVMLHAIRQLLRDAFDQLDRGAG